MLRVSYNGYYISLPRIRRGFNSLHPLTSSLLNGATKRKHYKFDEWINTNKQETKKGNLKFMYYVYILRSIKFVDNIYTGSTSDLKQRLKSHNEGSNKHTQKFRPWKVIWYSAFSTKKQAEKFEKYLKTASGIAFKRKRLI